MKLEQATKDQSKEIKKLKEDKLILSKQLMDLESEAIAYKDKPLDMLLNENNTFESFSFSLTNNTIVNKQVIKDNLKNKNEEILILKNELVKREKAMLELMKKQKDNDSYVNIHKSFKKINGTYLYRNKSDNDFIKTIIIKNKKRYFESGPQQQRKIGKDILNSNNNSNKVIAKTGGRGSKQDAVDILNMNKKRFEELNISIENEVDDEGHSALEKNISNEIKNILEEKRNFILQTMTYENFSFDIICNQKIINNTGINTSMTNENSNYIQQQQMKINQDIDEMITKIKKRKGIVDSQRRKLENMLNRFEISIN